MSPEELRQLADAVAERVISRLTCGTADDELIDVHAKAKQLNCSVATVERMAKSGKLESIKVGRLRRYARSAVPNKKGGCNHD